MRIQPLTSILCFLSGLLLPLNIAIIVVTSISLNRIDNVMNTMVHMPRYEICDNRVDDDQDGYTDCDDWHCNGRVGEISVHCVT